MVLSAVVQYDFKNGSLVNDMAVGENKTVRGEYEPRPGRLPFKRKIEFQCAHTSGALADLDIYNRRADSVCHADDRPRICVKQLIIDRAVFFLG
jgi:hypothetical protein